MPKGIKNAPAPDEFAPAPSPAPSKMVGPMDDMGRFDADVDARTKERNKGKKTVRITIAPGVGGDMSDVLIGHNYKLNAYKRGVALDMDVNYFYVLRDAVVTTSQQATPDATPVNVSIPQYQWTIDSDV